MSLNRDLQPGIDLSMLCKTTGWHNNCGLNCLSHFLISKLQNNELPIIFDEHPAYHALLTTFQQYYQLSQTPTWDEIRQILESYSNATDQEAILAPVLRQYLSAVLMKTAASVWDTEAATAISDYLMNGNIEDIAEPLIRPNLAPFLTEHRKEFVRRLALTKTQPSTKAEEMMAREMLVNAKRDETPENLRAQVEFIRENALQDEFRHATEAYWLNHGMHQYASYIGDLNNSVMVSADQLALLCKELEIGIEVYRPRYIDGIKQENDPILVANDSPEGGPIWQLKVYNDSHHWQYEEPSQDRENALAHNQFYPEAFYEQDDLGEFRIFSSLEENQEALIPAYVQSQFEHLKNRHSAAPLATIATTVAANPAHSNQKTPTPEVPTSLLQPQASFRPLALLRQFIANKRAQHLEYRYHKLHQQADIAMNKLVTKLDTAFNKGTVNETEKQVLFECYFNAMEEAFKKRANHTFDQRRIESLIKEVKRSDILSMKRYVLTEGKMGFELRTERKKHLQDSRKRSKP